MADPKRIAGALLVALFAGCGDGESLVPTRVLCEELAVATCRQYVAQACDDTIDPAQVDLYCDDTSLGGLIEGVSVQQCCVYMNCDGGREVTEADAEACRDALDGWYGCEQIEAGEVPPACWNTIGARAPEDGRQGRN